MKKSHLKVYSIAIVVLLIITSISVWALLKVKQSHIDSIKANKALEVGKLQNAIQLKIQGNISAIKLTERLFQSSENITRDEFQRYAEGVIELYPEVQVLEWLPLVPNHLRKKYEASVQKEGFPDFHITEKNIENKMVPAAEREFYTPVHFLVPRIGNENTFGLDSSSNLAAKAAIDIAIKSGETTLTAPLVLVQEKENQKAVLIYQPHFIHTSGEKKLNGFVLLVLRMSDFMGSLEPLYSLTEGHQFRLSDLASNSTVIAESTKVFSKSEDWFLISQEWKVANRTWQLQVNFDINTDASFQEGAFWSWMFFYVGMLIFILVSYLVYSRLKYREETKKSADAFHNEEERYQKLLNSSADAYFLQNMQGDLLDINQAACKAMGYSREELLKMNVLDVNVLIEGTTKQDYLDYFNSFPKGKTVHRELLYKRKDGTFFPVELSMNKFTYNNEDVLSGFIRDISERKEYENSLKRATRIAEQANNAKSEFLAKMSHEFRTPMHSVLSYSDMGLKRLHKVPLEKLESYFSNIQKSGNRLMRLLNNLLDLAKLETGKLKFCFEKRSLSFILDDCLNEQKNQINDKNISLDVSADNTTDRVVCDIDKIRQVITNLLSNAIKFTKPGSTIHISIEKDNQTLAVEGIGFCICDEGEGIPENELDDVFDKFVQSQKVSSTHKGTGLGLAICSEIIEGHLGKIWAENVSCGASLKFVIPLSPLGR